jgi:hypothetical protein
MARTDLIDLLHHQPIHRQFLCTFVLGLLERGVESRDVAVELDGRQQAMKGDRKQVGKVKMEEIGR